MLGIKDVATDSLLQVLGLHQKLSEVEHSMHDDSENTQSSSQIPKKSDNQEKVWEILQIPTSTAQDTPVSSNEGSSAKKLPKPGESGKYILVIGEQDQISMMEQSNLDTKVFLGPKNSVPEITVDSKHLKKSVNTSDFVPRIKVEDSDDAQVIGETQKEIISDPTNLYSYMQNFSQLLHKKKPGRPKKRKYQVEPNSFLDKETNDFQKNFMQDDEPISGKRCHGKLPSRWNDYTVENFDEAITSSTKTKLGKFSESEIDLSGDSNFDADLNAPDDDSLDDTPHRANKNLLSKLPRSVVIPLDGEAPQNTLLIDDKLRKLPSSEKRGRPQKFEPQHHIIVQNFSSNSFASKPGSAKPEFRQWTSIVTPIFNTNTVLSRSVQSQSENGMKTLVTAGREKILVPESGDEKTIPVDDNTCSGNSGFDGSINFCELIQNLNFSPLKKSTPHKQFSVNSDLFHIMPSTRGRGGAHNLKRRPGRPRKEDQLSRLTNSGILGTTLSELMTRKSSIVSRMIKEEREVKKNRVFVGMQDGTIVEVSGSDRQKAVLKANSKVEAIRCSVGRIREIEKAKYMEDDDNDYDDPKESGARYAYAFKKCDTRPALEDCTLDTLDDNRPALEDCTLDILDDNKAMILPNSVQLVESELPLSEADNCEKLQGVYLFRQIISCFDNTLQCLFCHNKYRLRFLPELEMHYRVIHELTVNISEAKFNENIVFVCVPSDVNEETALISRCCFCDTTLKTFTEVCDHYPNAHDKTVRLIPKSHVTEIGKFFYCSLCGHASADFPSHHQHMKVMHRMQTYACRYCTYCTSRPSRLRTHVKQRHLQDQTGPHLQCSMCSVYVHGEDRLMNHIMLSHAVQTGPTTWTCAKCLYPYGDPHKLMAHISTCEMLQSSSKAKSNETAANSQANKLCECNNCVLTSSSSSSSEEEEEEIEFKKYDDDRPALEDCTLDTLDDYKAMILPNSVQLVESELPLSEADNCEKLQGVYLFRQIISCFDDTLQCLFCHNKYSLRFPAELEIHYRVIHELAVNIIEAEFNENIVYVCVPSDSNEETAFKSRCCFCNATLKTFTEVHDHYPNAHNKTVRLVPESDVTKIRNFFYCSLCGHASADFPSHHQHMKVMHRMQTYACRYCTYCTSRPSWLRTHVKQRHHKISNSQNRPGPHLQCSMCAVYVHGEDRLMKHMLSHAVQTGPTTWTCAKCLYPYGDPHKLMAHMSTCEMLQSSSKAKSNETSANSQANKLCECNNCFNIIIRRN